VPIRALVPAPQDVPPGLEAIVLKCLSKRPEDRYQSMQELIVEFDKLMSGGVPDAVPEMMSRSGGFNVPVDYFKKGQMPAPVPATPSSAHGARRSRWPVYAGLAGVLAAIGIVVGIFANSHTSSAIQAPLGLTGATLEPTPAGSTTTALAIVTPQQASAPATQQVLLAAEPIDAHVFRGSEDLGQSPVLIAVEAGKSVDLEIRRDGYKPEKVALDGAKAREIVKLEKVTRAGSSVVNRPIPRSKPEPTLAAPAKIAPAKKPKSGIGGSEIVNPWGN
jgi:eukaryotic-like serine/threonine-protein kinase